MAFCSISVKAEMAIRARAKVPDPVKLLSRASRKLHTEWLRMTYPFASMGVGVSIHPTCTIDRMHAHRIKLGNNVMVEKDACLRICVSPEQEGEPIITIGDDCIIHWRSQIDAKNSIHLEQGVLIAQDVLMVDQTHAYENPSIPIRDQGLTSGGKIRIGQGSFIAHGAAIISTQGELVLGRNCVVAAHAVVTRSAPSYSVLYGNPARIIRQLDRATNSWAVGSAGLLESVLKR